MNVLERLDSFEFDDNFVFHEKVEPMLTNLVIAIEKRDWFLPNESNSAQRKFHRERLFVNRLQKPRSEFTMNSDRCGNNGVGRF